MSDFTDDLTLDDICTNDPEISDADKNAFFASLEVSRPTDEEYEAREMAEYEAREMADFDGHRDSLYW